MQSSDAKTAVRRKVTLGPAAAQIMGEVLWLCLHSPVHSRYELGRFESQVIPSIALDQFRIYRQGGKPIGFANWAWVADAILEKLCGDDYEIGPDDWQSGKRLWFPELIAPFGHGRLVVRDLVRNVFPRARHGRIIAYGRRNWVVDPDAPFKSRLARYSN